MGNPMLPVTSSPAQLPMHPEPYQKSSPPQQTTIFSNQNQSQKDFLEASVDSKRHKQKYQPVFGRQKHVRSFSHVEVPTQNPLPPDRPQEAYPFPRAEQPTQDPSHSQPQEANPLPHMEKPTHNLPPNQPQKIRRFSHVAVPTFSRSLLDQPQKPRQRNASPKQQTQHHKPSSRPPPTKLFPQGVLKNNGVLTAPSSPPLPLPPPPDPRVHPEPKLASLRNHANFLRANDMLIQSRVPEPVDKTLMRFRKAKIKVDWERIGVETKMVEDGETGRKEEKVVVRKGKYPKYDAEAFFARWVGEQVERFERVELKECLVQMARVMNANSMPKHIRVVQGKMGDEEIEKRRMANEYGVTRREKKCSSANFDWKVWQRILTQVPEVKARWRKRTRWKSRMVGNLNQCMMLGHEDLLEDTGGFIEDIDGQEFATSSLSSSDGTLGVKVVLGYIAKNGTIEDRYAGFHGTFSSEAQWPRISTEKRQHSFKDQNGSTASLSQAEADATVFK